MIRNFAVFLSFAFSLFAQPLMLSPQSGSALPHSTQVFTWDVMPAASAYWLYIGTNPGERNIFSGGNGLNTSITVGTLPTHGGIISVRLWALVDGVWVWKDYSYRAPYAAISILTPSPGVALAQSGQMLSWNKISGASEYWVYVGSDVGTRDVFSGSTGESAFVVLPDVPKDGRNLYVRIWYRVGTVWKSQDFTYLSENGETRNVGLAWNEMFDPTVAGFRIYYGSFGQYTEVIDVGYVYECKVLNLPRGVRYNFYATAYSFSGEESLPSESVSVTL